MKRKPESPVGSGFSPMHFPIECPVSSRQLRKNALERRRRMGELDDQVAGMSEDVSGFGLRRVRYL